YEIPKSEGEDIKPDPDPNTNISDYTAEDFIPYGMYKELGKDDFFVTYGLQSIDDIQSKINQVYYVFDDPSFYEKYVKSESKPYFSVSYQGPNCLEEMYAIVVLNDGSKITVPFDGCTILSDLDLDDLNDYVEIIPHVVATPNKDNPD